MTSTGTTGNNSVLVLIIYQNMLERFIPIIVCLQSLYFSLTENITIQFMLSFSITPTIQHYSTTNIRCDKTSCERNRSKLECKKTCNLCSSPGKDFYVGSCGIPFVQHDTLHKSSEHQRVEGTYTCTRLDRGQVKVRGRVGNYYERLLFASERGLFYGK